MTEIEKIRQAIKDAVSGNWKEDYDLASKAIEQYVIKAKMEMILKYCPICNQMTNHDEDDNCLKCKGVEFSSYY